MELNLITKTKENMKMDYERFNENWNIIMETFSGKENEIKEIKEQFKPGFDILSHLKEGDSTF